MSAYQHMYTHVLVLLSTAMVRITESTLKGPFDVCEREVFNASCSTNDVIMIRSAMYGRMDVGRCIRSNIGTRNCDIDVLNILDGLCSGLTSCSVKGVYSALLNIKPCPDHAAFLRASYECLQVLTNPSTQCSNEFHISNENGYLASSKRTDYGAGTVHCPWSIDSEKRMNITLYKFISSPSSPLASSSSVCFEIGTIQDGGMSHGILTCGSDPRSKVIHVSKGSKVKVHFKDNSFLRDLGHFLIHFRVLGCPEPKVPPHASFTRNGESVEITCEADGNSWQMQCVNGKWEGEEGQCSQGHTDSNGERSVFHWIKSNTAYSLGLLGLVTLGCAVVIFVGGFICYVACFYITRKHQQNSQRANPTVDAYTLKTMHMNTLKKPVYIGTYQHPAYQRPTSVHGGTLKRNSDYQRMNPIDPETVSHHSYVLYDHVPKPLPPIPLEEERKHIYETPLPPERQ